jgi:hypothetical protein
MSSGTGRISGKVHQMSYQTINSLSLQPIWLRGSITTTGRGDGQGPECQVQKFRLHSEGSWELVEDLEQDNVMFKQLSRHEDGGGEMEALWGAWSSGGGGWQRGGFHKWGPRRVVSRVNMPTVVKHCHVSIVPTKSQALSEHLSQTSQQL